MSTQSINQSYPIFTDIDGQPLESGYIYIGTAGLAAATNQITVYWDEALTIPATQPIRTTGGYLMNGGTPGNIYTNLSDYSIAINNKNNSAVTSALNVTRLPEYYADVKNYGAIGDGVVDDTAAINACLAANDNVFLSSGTYKISAQLNMKDGQHLRGVRGKSVIEVTHEGYAIYAVGLSSGGSVTGVRVNSNLLSYGIIIFATNNFTVSECHFKEGKQDSILIDGDVTNITISNCFIDDAFRNGISVIDGENIVIDGCQIIGTDQSRTGGSPYSGIDVEPDGGGDGTKAVDGIRVSNCKIKDWGGHGCAFAGAAPANYVDNAVFVGNDVDNNGFDCVAILGAYCLGATITGNFFKVGNHGVFSSNIGTTPARCVVTGNFFSSQPGATGSSVGIEFEVDTQATISGNTIDGLFYPMKISGCISGVNLSGNVVSNCGQPLTLFSSDNVNITGNLFKACQNIDVQTCRGVIIQSNSFHDMDDTITMLVNVRLSSSEISVVDNTFRGTGAGLVSFVAQAASTDVYISGNQGVNLGGISTWKASGAWTPTYLGTSSNPTVGYDGTVVGHWERQGDLVYISGFLMTDSISGGSGTVRIGGLPYDVAAGDCCNGGITISFSSDFTTNQPSSMRALGGTKELDLYYRASSNGNSTDLPISDLLNGANKNILYFGGVYRTTETA